MLTQVALSEVIEDTENSIYEMIEEKFAVDEEVNHEEVSLFIFDYAANKGLEIVDFDYDELEKILLNMQDEVRNAV